MTKDAFHPHIDGAIALIYGAPRPPRGETPSMMYLDQPLVAAVGILEKRT
jgi:hypothetical protein